MTHRSKEESRVMQEGKRELTSMGDALNAAPESGYCLLHAIWTVVGLSLIHIFYQQWILILFLNQELQ